MKDVQTVLAAAALGIIMSSPSIGPMVEQATSPIIADVEFSNLTRDQDRLCADLILEKFRAAKPVVIAWRITGSEDHDATFVSAVSATTERNLTADPFMKPGRASNRLCWSLAQADWLRDDVMLTVEGIITYDGWLHWEMPYRIGPVSFPKP